MRASSERFHELVANLAEDVFGDAGGCASLPTPPGCQLNPLMNSAFLVPDPGE